MPTDAPPRGGAPGGLTAWIVAPQPRQRQVRDEPIEFRGGLCGERRLQPRLVLLHREVALRECQAELIGGPLTLAVARAKGDWGGHGSSRSLDLDTA
jgi:hypothetical protein